MLAHHGGPRQVPVLVTTAGPRSSATHLNRLCRQILGYSALEVIEVIERRIGLEARRQLVFSTLPIKQIAAELGYDDPACFSRAMRRLLGEAPATLRQRSGR